MRFHRIPLRGAFLLVVLAAVAVLAAPSFAASQADCSGTSASGSIGSVSASSGIVSASGSYSTTGTGALLRYSIDGVLYQTETKTSSSGSWSFVDNFSQTCQHELEVEICPTVCDGGGCAVCEQHCTTKQSHFIAQPCAPRLIRTECTSTSPTGVWSMSARATGGIPGYQLCSSTNGGPFFCGGSFTNGPWSGGGRCSAPGWTVRWFVKDTAGQSSNTVSCRCGAIDEVDW